MNDEYRKAFHAAFSHTTRAKCIEVNTGLCLQHLQNKGQNLVAQNFVNVVQWADVDADDLTFRQIILENIKSDARSSNQRYFAINAIKYIVSEIFNFSHWQVNVIGSLFYGLFRFFISRKLREKISQDRHDSFLCFYGSFEKLTSSDLIGNTIVGHAFLIDSEGFVRWKACAKPTKDELESMIKCCKQLLP